MNSETNYDYYDDLPNDFNWDFDNLPPLSKKDLDIYVDNLRKQANQYPLKTPEHLWARKRLNQFADYALARWAHAYKARKVSN